MMEHFLLELICAAADDAWHQQKLSIEQIQALFRVWEYLAVGVDTSEFTLWTTNQRSRA